MTQVQNTTATTPPSPPSPSQAPVKTPLDPASTTNSSTTQTINPPSSYTLKKRLWRRQITPFETILAHNYPGAGTDSDPYIVDWIANDPEDPQRWPTVYKWSNIAIVSMATLAVALSSSAYSGGLESLIRDFGASEELLTGGISLFVVGFAFGPLLWAPASEVYGRRIIFIISYAMLTLWQGVTAASPNVAAVLVFRFLAGLFGSSPLANAGGTISDILDANQRGLGMALFAAAPFLGPALGPITGGFLGLTSGWRWVEGFLAIFCGVICLVLLLFSAETYAPQLLRRRAATLSRATGKHYRFRADAKKALVVSELFQASLLRPWKFLIYEPIVLILTIYTALIYGILYLNFAAYPIVFQELRGWNSGVGGLAFLGILVGVILSVTITIVYVNPQYIKIAKANGGRAAPEDRLPSSIWGGVLIVIGLAGFAATDGENVHWIAPIIFGIPFGLGVITVFLAVLGYLVDSYTIYAASVMAANSVLRSLFGAAFPLFTKYMYDALGIHWAAALPGFIAAAMIPFTYLFWKHGAKIRARCKYAADAERQMNFIIAARIAAAKKAAGDVEDNETTTPKGPAVGGATEKPGSQTFPAEQAGGQGTTAIEAQSEKVPVEHGHAGHPSHPEHPAHKEWTIYSALADRDEVDLSDDERVRLDELHRRFAHQQELQRRQSLRSVRSQRSQRSHRSNSDARTAV
ncbi:multiple drug resistance protein [Naematelia encephala]|uniref:Multiple drug resistance protein n=1 Tax=Naematelia encephala TaxID=71784 RepID=A0A1Y2B195_9TREE|nr:multiple drug resistance protein [Naematelia encephala]